MIEEFSVKGATILSKYKYVEEQFGAESYNVFLKKLREKKIPMVFTAGWYPFLIFNSILQQISKEFFQGDVTKLEQVGAYSARSSFGSLYRKFLNNNGFLSFLARAPQLHKMFYSHGQMHIDTAEDGKSCRITIQDQPVITDEDTYVTAGFYKQSAMLHGIEKLQYNLKVKNGLVIHALSWV